MTWLALVILGTEIRGLLEVQLLWILVGWNLGGVLVVNLIDALAARHDVADAKRPTAELRLRSLKLVGRVVVIIGLTLALTSRLVGQGTIYNWVLSTCWFLAVPVALWIVVWWRRVIFERLEPRVEGSTVAAWVVARKDSWTSLVAATVGGVFLMGLGTAKAVARYVGGFVLTRRLLAYLFRREIAKQSKRQEVEGDLSPYPRKKCAEFDPDTRAAELLSTAADADLQSVQDVIDAPGGGVFALVGERGSGKSTLLRRIVDAHPDCLRLRCPTGGLSALLADLRQLLGLRKDATGEQIRAALDKRADDHALLIDDCQRLVSPTIDGLRDLDSLLELARDASDTCAWVLAFDAALWEFVRRARGVRPVFDDVLVIRPWTEEMIAALVRQRSSQAGVKPRFDHLLPPGSTNEYRRAEQLARTEAGYYRLLWDYSAGNPAVALRFWCHSLFVESDGDVFVQLFATPEMADLEELPDATVFVLRAVLQLEPVRVSELATATRISPRQVEEAVRYARVRGYLNTDGDRVRLSWDWYRAVSRLLQRRHLLALPGSV
jgi:type II secretory pathway predicted ATPase ExeA